MRLCGRIECIYRKLLLASCANNMKIHEYGEYEYHHYSYSHYSPGLAFIFVNIREYSHYSYSFRSSTGMETFIRPNFPVPALLYLPSRLKLESMFVESATVDRIARLVRWLYR